MAETNSQSRKKRVSKSFILNVLKENKPILTSKMGVKSIALFGSFAREENRPGSDIDILVELNSPDFLNFMEVQFFLEKKFKHKTEVLRLGSHLRPEFLNSIKKDLIYA